MSRVQGRLAENLDRGLFARCPHHQHLAQPLDCTLPQVKGETLYEGKPFLPALRPASGMEHSAGIPLIFCFCAAPTSGTGCANPE